MTNSRLNKGYSNLQLAGRYGRYLFNSKTRYKVHSPFVFHLIENVLHGQQRYYFFTRVEKLRQSYLQSKKAIKGHDFGAGSRGSSARSIEQIAKKALSPIKQGEWLFRLVSEFKPKLVVELGTSLGISTAYMAGVNTKTRVISFEGNEDLISIAVAGWRKLGLNNISCIPGNIDNELPNFLNKLNEPIGLVFLDANHTYEATMNYFELFLPKLSENSIVVMDDIHWSSGMEKAWLEICEKEEVSVSIDMFYKGLLFFKKDIKKEHFVLRV